MTRTKHSARHRVAIALMLTLALIGSACGGDDDSATSATFESGEDDGSASETTAAESALGTSDDDGASSADDSAEVEEDTMSEDSGDAQAAPTTTSQATETSLLAESASAESEADELAEELAMDDTESAATVDERANRGDAADGIFGSQFEDDGDAEADLARDQNNTFVNPGVRSFVETSVDPLSTFALDVDTGSYAIARRWLDEQRLPEPDSVRVEEYVNAFDYDYEAPDSGIGLSIEGGPSPFPGGDTLIRVGVQSEIIDIEDRPDASLTFLIDTSGSMDADNRLGLVKASLSLLVHELEPDDVISIVTYDSNAGVALQPTPVSDITTILEAIGRLQTGGSTNLEAGLATAYELAENTYRRNGVNRVILASDGVANVGLTDPDGLTRQITEDAARGIQLVTLGFGMGNYNDDTMEQLADQGDGFYSYIDTYEEAERIFKDELAAALVTVARDAKIQVEFDDEVVAAYRLIGFENRAVRDRDFRNDAVDAGEIGTGHQVTALYQIDLRKDVRDGDSLGEVRLRWLNPATDEAIEISQPIMGSSIEPDWYETSVSFQLATTVGTWAEILRFSPYATSLDLERVAVEAERLADETDRADVKEFAELTRTAAQLA